VRVKGTGLERHYSGLERRYDLVEAMELGELVVPNGNAERPFHRWFHLKEGYSCDLLSYVLGATGLEARDELAILDPFAGGGTTMVSAAEWAQSKRNRRVHALGIERNPFLAFLAQVKADALTAVEVTVGSATAPRGRAVPLPELSTFRNHDFFDPAELQELLKLRRAILSERDGLARRLRLLALVTCVEPVSRLRRDGRTLRRAIDKPRVRPRDAFCERLDRITDDIDSRDAKSTAAIRLAVEEGDGRRPKDLASDGFRTDLVVCSPPYPNNIDYTEVYKLEAWFMGAYGSADEFRSQRHRTLRSHPSVKFADPPEIKDTELKAELDELIKPLIAALPRDRYVHSRQRLICGYVEDMALTLKRCLTLSKPGGWMAVIIGNSLHGAGDGSVLVAADLLIARAAELVGWDVARIDVGRRPARRSGAEPRLRESMVLLRHSP
jgi:hypothetical protein